MNYFVKNEFAYCFEKKKSFYFYFFLDGLGIHPNGYIHGYPLDIMDGFESIHYQHIH
ncbi:hypothetical protein Lalb_Chr07g0190381 [Lupinus albus]|uniref:Uncharacterized protein n=1 Tax=Lupinus albus TaxID=3870 RepID=A0A6A4QAV7_LUPAL|nr:hypothetical protein Lalb_Chr07g0190381 [Lupinus albus]